MRRRNFLGFLGGAAVAGPSAAKTAAGATMGDLSLLNAGAGWTSTLYHGSAGSMVSGPDQTGWARESLKRLLGRTAIERAMNKRRHSIHSLHPHYAACRSVSLVNKIRMSKDADFEREEALQKSYLQGVIDKLWE